MQKALSNILQHYLRQETLVTGDDGGVDEELLESLHKCLEEKGVLKDVHAFLRQRLVAVLRGTWPQLFDHFRKDSDLNPIVLKLVEDFLCSHKLLFALSVLTTELGDAFCPKVGFGKFSSLDAEGLLFNLGIRPDSVQSQKILENYAAAGNKSLFECLITFSPSGIHGASLEDQRSNGVKGGAGEGISSNGKNFLTLDERLKKIDDKFRRQVPDRRQKEPNLKRAEFVDQHFRHLALDLERDKQIQLQIAIDKFKAEEIMRIREEIETSQKFELLRKEKELLANYEEKVTHLKNNLEREKELWLFEKAQKENEILKRRDELLAAMQSVHPKSGEDKIYSEASTQTAEETAFQGHIPPPNVTEIVPKTLETFLFARNPEQREMERAYLLREAKLKVAIEKLEKENRYLKTAPPAPPRQMVDTSPKRNSKRRDPTESDSEESRDKRRRSPVNETSTRDTRPRARDTKRSTKSRRAEGDHTASIIDFGRFPVPVPDTDAMAFLQYQLECQSEEIEKLRNALQMRALADMSPRKVTFQQPIRPAQASNLPEIPKYLESPDVDQFLREAKQRISDIEQEAHLVEESLLRMHQSDLPVVTSGYKTASTNSSHPVMPNPPKIPKALFQRLSTLREPIAVSKPVNQPRPVFSVPSIPPIEKSFVSFLPTTNHPSEVPPPLRQSLYAESTKTTKPSSVKTYYKETAKILRGSTIAKELDTVEDSRVSDSCPESSCAADELNAGAGDENLLAGSARSAGTPSSTSMSSLSRSGHRALKGDNDKSLGRDTKHASETNGQEKVVVESGELSERLSMESTLERASRSGALVKNKVDAGGGGDRGGGGGGESLSSSLQSSSAEVLSKSLEKAGRKLEEGWKGEAAGERFRDSKSNRISANPNSSLSATSNKGTVSKPQLPGSLAPALPATLQNFQEEELDDLGMLETSEDLPGEQNLFWQM